MGSLQGSDGRDDPAAECVGARLVSYLADIRPLFGPRDRMAMINVCDLWSYDDVVSHAETIAERIAEGSLPGDHPLSDAKVSMFDRWVVEGACL